MHLGYEHVINAWQNLNIQKVGTFYQNGIQF